MGDDTNMNAMPEAGMDEKKVGMEDGGMAAPVVEDGDKAEVPAGEDEEAGETPPATV